MDALPATPPADAPADAPPVAPPDGPWRLARRAARLAPSAIREILKATEQPHIVSLAGGLPAPEGFPVPALRAAAERVWRDAPSAALQYATTEGYTPLREWIAEHLAERGMQVSPAQVLVTTGSQQGLDLVAKLLLDPGSTVGVEAPTYLGALQAFTPAEPCFAAIDGDDEGPLPEALARLPRYARLLYLLPTFQNPSGRTLGDARRDALLGAAAERGLPLVEDDPYCDLWYDARPPSPLAARDPARTVYLGSFSKVLAPGLRVGYLVAPPALLPKLVQAKQASDLHTPSFNQRLVHEAVRDGLLSHHLPALRARYRAQRDAMHAALQQHLAPLGCRWQRPAGGMFFWLRLPPALDAAALLPQAMAAGVAYVPGAAFFAQQPQAHTLRLSFATVPPARIGWALGRLAQVLAGALARPQQGAAQ